MLNLPTKQKIGDHYLQCFTQQEIAEKLGWDQSIISRDLQEFMQNIDTDKMHKFSHSLPG